MKSYGGSQDDVDEVFKGAIYELSWPRKLENPYAGYRIESLEENKSLQSPVKSEKTELLNWD